jgi:hypothetical protein
MIFIRVLDTAFSRALPQSEKPWISSAVRVEYPSNPKSAIFYNGWAKASPLRPV